MNEKDNNTNYIFPKQIIMIKAASFENELFQKGVEPWSMVKADSSQSRGHVFKPQYRILDGCWLLIVFTQHNLPSTL